MSHFSSTGDLSPEVVAAPRLIELVSGIDSLYWSVDGTLLPEEEERLASVRANTEVAGEPVSIEIGGEVFLLQPYGFMRRYRYHPGAPLRPSRSDAQS